MKLYRLTFSFIFVLTLLACNASAETAKADLRGTALRPALRGQALFEQQEGGMKVTVELENAIPGRLAFHIHENGSCADNGKAAGGHFNPAGTPHGNVVTDGVEKAHPGDFGNLEIGENGSGKKEFLVKELSLSEGKYAILGKSMIIHAKEDTFEQPTGNAGERIACGIIEKA